MDRDFMLFHTEAGSPYVYDANTNTVHPLPCAISEESLALVYDTPPGQELPALGNKPQLANLLRYIGLWRGKTDAFQRKPVQRRIELQSLEKAQRLQVSSGLSCDLILVVTEQCNMRCAYCVYEKDLYDNRRTHTASYMDKATARKAIDLYFNMNESEVFKPLAKRALNIVFYGGEPLLNWPVVSYSVAYAREKYAGDIPLYLGMTSNLTLLDPAWLPFLREHDVFINVSMDGPQKEHDRYRHFAGGEPTFDAVYQNLKAIRDFDEEYFLKNIKAAVTCNGNTQYDDVVEFFDKDDYSPNVYTVSMLKNLETGRFHARYPYNPQKRKESLAALRERYEQYLQKGQTPPRGSALYALIYDAQSTHFHLPHSVRGHREWFTGSCLPGRKIVVAPGGEIHPCERIGMDYPVGHIGEGLNKERLLRYFNSFFASTDECGECWARARCTICPAEVDGGGELKFENKCEMIRENVRNNLFLEYTQLEKTPSMFSGEFAFY